MAMALKTTKSRKKKKENKIMARTRVVLILIALTLRLIMIVSATILLHLKKVHFGDVKLYQLKRCIGMDSVSSVDTAAPFPVGLSCELL